MRAGAKMYYASHGLQRATEIWRGQLGFPDGYPWDFANEYVAIKWGDSLADLLDDERAKEVSQKC